MANELESHDGPPTTDTERSASVPAAPSANDPWYVIVGPWYCAPQSAPAS